MIPQELTGVKNIKNTIIASKEQPKHGKAKMQRISLHQQNHPTRSTQHTTQSIPPWGPSKPTQIPKKTVEVAQMDREMDEHEDPKK